MSIPHMERPDLPETMTWEELEQLPEEIAEFIELRDGRPVWVADEILVRHGPTEHQRFSRRMANTLETAATQAMGVDGELCLQVELETNVFLSPTKSSFLTPDFMVFRCLAQEFGWIFAADVVLVGEVLSPANTPRKVEEKKRRYAAGGIPWYWEVELAQEPRRISVIRSYALATDGLQLPQGVTPLRTANYIQTDEWTPETHDIIETTHPFTISIPWADLAF